MLISSGFILLVGVSFLCGSSVIGSWYLSHDQPVAVIYHMTSRTISARSLIRVAGCSLQHGYHSNPTTPKLQHTSNQEQYDQCGNSTE